MSPENVLHESPRIVENEWGVALFEGTRIPIYTIVSRAKTATSVPKALDDFLAFYPELTEAHFKSAARYYIQNLTEIDKQIEARNRSFEESSRAQRA